MPAGSRKTCKAPVIAHLFYAGCPSSYLTSTGWQCQNSLQKCLSTVHLGSPPSVAQIRCTGSISTHGMSLWTHYHVFMDSLLLVFVYSSHCLEITASETRSSKGLPEKNFWGFLVRDFWALVPSMSPNQQCQSTEGRVFPDGQ